MAVVALAEGGDGAGQLAHAERQGVEQHGRGEIQSDQAGAGLVAQQPTALVQQFCGKRDDQRLGGKAAGFEAERPEVIGEGADVGGR